MRNDRRTIAGIVTYAVLTFALSSIFYRAILAKGGIAHSQGLIFGLMWCPGVSGLLTRLLFQRTLTGVGWRWGHWKYQWASYSIPLAYVSAVYLPLWSAGYANFQNPSLARFAVQFHLPSMSQPLLVVAYIFLMATVGLMVSCLSATGEELGWRGFLVPELAKVTSFTGVAVISGLNWSLYHLPLILAGGYRGAGPVWYSVLCFFAMTVGMSVLLAWLRLKSGSVWTGVIFHASHNLFIQLIFDPLTRPAPLTNYMTGEFGAGLAIMSLLLAFLFWRKRDELASSAPRSPLCR